MIKVWSLIIRCQYQFIELLSLGSINTIGNGLIKSEPLSPTSSTTGSNMNSPPYCQQFALNPNYVQDPASISQYYRQFSNRGSVGSSGGTNSFPPSPTNSDMSSSSSDNCSAGNNFVLNPQVIQTITSKWPFMWIIYSNYLETCFL